MKVFIFLKGFSIHKNGQKELLGKKNYVRIRLTKEINKLIDNYEINKIEDMIIIKLKLKLCNEDAD